MPRSKTRVSPSLEVVESRTLLSAAGPVMTPHALNVVVRDIRGIMNTLARTDDTARASRHLTRLSSRVPSGREGLAPAWRADVGLYSPGTVGSIFTTQGRIVNDLYQYIAIVGGGSGPVTRSGSSPSPNPGTGAGMGSSTGTGTSTGTDTGAGGSTTPEPAASLDSVNIQNTTGLALRVTVHLNVPQVQKPSITWIIPSQGRTTQLFDFRSSTGAFMSMDVSRADGGQTPPPFNNVNLSEPIGGYKGTTFSISVFGSWFNISPL